MNINNELLSKTITLAQLREIASNIGGVLAANHPEALSLLLTLNGAMAQASVAVASGWQIEEIGNDPNFAVTKITSPDGVVQPDGVEGLLALTNAGADIIATNEAPFPETANAHAE